MYYERKTRDRNMLYIIWFPLTVVISFFAVATSLGFGPAFYLLGAIYLAASVIPFLTFWRTRNAGFLAVALWQVFVALVCISAPPAINDRSEAGLIPLFIAGMYVLGIIVAYLAFNRKLKWRGQEIFELAAMSVEDTGNGFTARPRPTGQISISKTEMIRFVDFITTNLIAFAFREENRVVFVLALTGKDMPYLLGLKKDYIEDTWVAIDFDGNISVNITQKDYLIFKRDLAFDQLCQSLGNVFVEFLELSKRGKNTEIIDRMNALRLNPFS